MTLNLGYNPAGQIVSKASSNDAYTFTALSLGSIGASVNGLNQLTSLGGAAASHDPRGNLTSDPVLGYTFGYSSENLLTSVSGHGGVGPNGLLYDPLMRLWQAGSNRSDYDGHTRIADHQAGGTLNRYVHGPGIDEPLVEYGGANLADRYFLLADERGSIIAATNDSGTVTAIGRYDDYGKVQSYASRFGFAGMPVETMTGLYYARARMYNPRLGAGRFMQTDPIRYDDQINLYAYAGNDPVNLFDATGRRAEVVGNKIKITPFFGGHPQVAIPRGQTGASGITGRELSIHRYNVATPTETRNARAMGDAIARNPTPGAADRPATTAGQINDVGRLPFNPGPNLVQSFRVPSPDASKYTDITVNYTIKGEHGLEEGFVMRYGEIGPNGNITIVTYGEGNAWEQNSLMKPIWQPQVEKTWKAVDDQVLQRKR